MHKMKAIRSSEELTDVLVIGNARYVAPDGVGDLFHVTALLLHNHHVVAGT